MSASFCTSCGQPLPNTPARFCTRCGAERNDVQQPTRRFCTSCGKAVENPNTKFCTGCGAGLTAGAPPAPRPSPPGPAAPPPPAVPAQPPVSAHAPAVHAPKAPPPKSRSSFPLVAAGGAIVAVVGAALYFGGLMPDVAWPGGGGAGDYPPAPELQDVFELRGGPVVYTDVGLLEPGQEIHIEESSGALPAAPDGLEPVGASYEISAPAGVDPGETGYFVRLPLPDPSIAEDESQQVYIGHHDGTQWEIFAAHVEDGWASAQVSHFSRFSIFVLPRRTTVTAAELPSVVIDPPKIWGYTLRGGLAYANVDVSPSRTARVGNNYRGVVVERLRVYMSQPLPNPARAQQRGLSSRNLNAFRPYQVNGEDLYLQANYLSQMMVLEFDPAATMPIGASDVYTAKPFWWMRVAPVFADGSEGPLSDPVQVIVGAVEAPWRLRRGLMARMTPEQSTEFEQLTWDNPVVVLPHRGSLTADLYHPASATRLNRIRSMLYTSQARNFIGLGQGSTYSDVVTHEWGHFTVHTIYGDDAFLRLRGGSHSGWREGASRNLVWSEDLATWLGQWGTERGVPASAGSMRGRWENASRDPSGEDNASTAWPNNTDMDATRVEMVWATALSRLTREVGFSRMYTFMRSNPVVDGIRFSTAWSNESNEDMATLQKILLEEGVAWKIRGRVVGQTEEGAEPEPLEGVAVLLQTLSNDQDLYPDVVGDPIPIYTDDDGYFEIHAPPGLVHIALVKQGWESDTYDTHSVDTRGPTNGEVQVLEDDLLMVPNAPPEVTITAPSPGEILTERVVTVTGTVEGTLDGTENTGPITTARMQVGGETYDVAVSDGYFSQEVVLEPGSVTITVTAENQAGSSSASVSVEAAIEATILKIILTWAGSSSDVDLWVTDPEGISTGYNNQNPAEGRQLDIDDTDGFGPETYTMSLPIRGTYRVRVNYYGGEGSESFQIRWVIWEGTDRESRGNSSGSLSDADGNEGTPAANRSFTIEVR